MHDRCSPADGAEAERDGYRADLPDFAVLTVSVGGEVVVVVRGEVDMATAPQLWQFLEQTLPEATERLIVDLAETTFIDSTAVAVFSRAYKRLRLAGGDLVIRSPSKPARKIFAITGLDRVMTIEGEKWW